MHQCPITRLPHLFNCRLCEGAWTGMRNIHNGNIPSVVCGQMCGLHYPQPLKQLSRSYMKYYTIKKMNKKHDFFVIQQCGKNIPTLGFCGVFWHAAPLRLHPMRTCPSPDPNWAINTSVRCNISNAVQPNNKVLHKVHFTLYTQECSVVTQREVSLRPSSICSMFLKHWQHRLLPVLSWREFLYVWGLREADQSPGRKHLVQECRVQGHFACRLC